MEDGERRAGEEERSNLGLSFTGHEQKEERTERDAAPRDTKREEEVNFEVNSSTIYSSAARATAKWSGRGEERGRGDEIILMHDLQSVGRKGKY